MDDYYWPELHGAMDFNGSRLGASYDTLRLMLSLEDAQARMLAAIAPLENEMVSLPQCAGRCAAEDVRAIVDLPGFDNSSMDGYAVRSADVATASAANPATLRIIAHIPAGTAASVPVVPGTAARIFTGSVMPPGADAVVMQEDTEADGEQVSVHDAVIPFENVRRRGEDIRADDAIVSAGTAIHAGTVALLGAAGVGEVRVFRRPVLGFVATGNELVEPGRPLQPGEIYESNRVSLACLAEQAGAIARIYPVVADSLEATRAALERAFAECDAVVTTGGVSVGEHDYVKAAFEATGGSLDFWRVALRPGKPFVFGRRGAKFLFGLPGNPVSAFVTFQVLVRPALMRWQGARTIGLPSMPGVLAEPVTNDTSRRHLMRVSVDSQGMVRSAGPQGSHRLASLAGANGLLDVPPNAEWQGGRTVTVMRLD